MELPPSGGANRAPVEILSSLGVMIEFLHPEIFGRLGVISATGPTEEDGQWMDDLADAADRLTGALQVIYDRVNTTPTYTHPSGSEEVTPPTDNSSEAEIDITVTNIFQPSEEPESDKINEESEQTPDQLPVVLSSNELLAVELTINFLATQNGNQSLRDIALAVFGRAKLPKNDEARLMQILEAYTRAGQLVRYGKSFRLRTLEDQLRGADVDESDQLELDQLADDEKALVDYIVHKSHEGQINIGQIVREYYGVQQMEQTQFHDLVIRLNQLAGREYLVHEERSSWYGPGSKSEWLLEAVLPNIETPALSRNPDEREAREKEEDRLDVISSLVLKFARSGEFFGVGDLRKPGGPLYELPEEEHRTPSLQFTEIRKAIIDHLSERGELARWNDNGKKTRGKKYQLLVLTQTK